MSNAQQNLNPADLYLVCMHTKTVVRHIGPAISIYRVQPGQVLMNGEHAAALGVSASTNVGR